GNFLYSEMPGRAATNSSGSFFVLTPYRFSAAMLSSGPINEFQSLVPPSPWHVRQIPVAGVHDLRPVANHGNKSSSARRSAQWDKKASHLPISAIQPGKTNIKPPSSNLTQRSCWTAYTLQKRRFSNVFKNWHKTPTAQTIKP